MRLFNIFFLIALISATAHAQVSQTAKLTIENRVGAVVKLAEQRPGLIPYAETCYQPDSIVPMLCWYHVLKSHDITRAAKVDASGSMILPLSRVNVEGLFIQVNEKLLLIDQTCKNDKVNNLELSGTVELSDLIKADEDRATLCFGSEDVTIVVD